jgi:hypothetical protein
MVQESIVIDGCAPSDLGVRSNCACPMDGISCEFLCPLKKGFMGSTNRERDRGSDRYTSPRLNRNSGVSSGTSGKVLLERTSWLNVKRAFCNRALSKFKEPIDIPDRSVRSCIPHSSSISFGWNMTVYSFAQDVGSQNPMNKVHP